MIDLRTKKIEKICIVMLGLLGDIIMRTPIVREIRKIYPNAKITVVTDPIGMEVLKDNPDVDEIIVADRSKNNYLRYLYSKLQVQVKVISRLFDLMISLYGGNSGYKLARYSFAKYQIGIKSGYVWTNKKFSENNKKSNFKNRYHLTNGLFRVLKYFNISIDELDTTPFLYYSEDTKARVDKYTNSFADKNYYLISLGSGGIEKISDMQTTFELIKYIYEKYSMIPAVISNPGQEYLQQELIDKYLTPNSIEFIQLKAMSIDEITYFIKISKFLIVPDTGLFHIAVSQHTPIFSIFTFTNPKLVEPSQGKYKIIFKEDSSLDINKDLELKFGTKDIKLSEIKSEFDKFYAMLE